MMAARSTYRLLFALSLAGLICTTPVQSADWLDEMDQRFEQTFQASDAAFDRAIVEGVEELDRELGEIWGEQRKLPEAKVWVGYSQDRKTRIIVDYDRGEMSVESFDKSHVDLGRDFQDILLEDSPKLDERAALRRKLIDKVSRLDRPRPVRETPRYERAKPRPDFKPRALPQPAEQPTAKSVKPAIKWVQPRELSNLIKPRSKPVFVSRQIKQKNGKIAKLSRMTIPLRKDRDQLSAQALIDPVGEMAEKYDLPRALILSVIKNESAFNPRARSHANALGLMQLVATSGGKEAYSYLLGREATPGPDVLYDPIENIRLGATYLYLLNTRYFGKVKDPMARRHLIIAAYNTGAGNVAKAFTGKMKLRAAIKKINRLSADEVYNHLRAHLPYSETKTYLARVTKDTQTFANYDA